MCIFVQLEVGRKGQRGQDIAACGGTGRLIYSRGRFYLWARASCIDGRPLHLIGGPGDRDRCLAEGEEHGGVRGINNKIIVMCFLFIFTRRPEEKSQTRLLPCDWWWQGN